MTFKNLKDVAELILTFFSVSIAVIVYLSSKKLFRLEVANKRADKVNTVFKEATSTGKRVADLLDSHYITFWTETVSEIVISINLIEKLTWNSKLSMKVVGYKEIKYVFWEQLHTCIRQHFEGFNSEALLALEQNAKCSSTLKQQIKTIVNFSADIVNNN